MGGFTRMAAGLLVLACPLAVSGASAQTATPSAASQLAALKMQSATIAQQTQAYQADVAQASGASAQRQAEMAAARDTLVQKNGYLLLQLVNVIAQLESFIKNSPAPGAAGAAVVRGTSDEAALAQAQALFDQTVAAQAQLTAGQGPTGDSSGSPVTVPEPSTWAMFVVALGMVCAGRYRMRRTARG